MSAYDHLNELTIALVGNPARHHITPIATAYSDLEDENGYLWAFVEQMKRIARQSHNMEIESAVVELNEAIEQLRLRNTDGGLDA